MAGSGSTLVAALRSGRHSVGLELNPVYASMAQAVLEEERQSLGEKADGLIAEIITADAARLPEIIAKHPIPPVDYVLTSPPYWDMLHASGFETQKKRRSASDLDVVYLTIRRSGNLSDYAEFWKANDDLPGTETAERGLPDDHCQEREEGGKVYP
jgi:DNA modification methylase